VYKGQKPKYMNKKPRDLGTAAFYSDDTLLLQDPLQGTVITEDICSTVRVGRVVSSVSTLGTTLSYKLAVRLFGGQEQPFYIWYDGDAAGIKGAKNASDVFDMLGAQYRVIRTEHDPKRYNYDEIREIINDRHYATTSVTD